MLFLNLSLCRVMSVYNVYMQRESTLKSIRQIRFEMTACLLASGMDNVCHLTVQLQVTENNFFVELKIEFNYMWVEIENCVAGKYPTVNSVAQRSDKYCYRPPNMSHLAVAHCPGPVSAEVSHHHYIPSKASDDLPQTFQYHFLITPIINPIEERDKKDGSYFGLEFLPPTMISFWSTDWWQD